MAYIACWYEMYDVLCTCYVIIYWYSPVVFTRVNIAYKSEFSNKKFLYIKMHFKFLTEI